VSLVVDGEHDTVRYGDSFGDDMPSDLWDACQWWLTQHKKSPFTLETLPIGVQELHDTSSCGFLSHNSLEHFAFPESDPLLACSGIQAARMSHFILASQQILAQVRTSNWHGGLS
jgi:hypothetical protein